MRWKLNALGQYTRGQYVIDILPGLDDIRPYYLFKNGGYVGNYASLDIAKRMADNYE